MRPAPPSDEGDLVQIEPAPPEILDIPESERPAAHRALLRRPVVWAGAGVGAAAVAAILAAVVLGGGSAGPNVPPGPTPPGVTPRVPFSFPLGAVTSTSFTGKASSAAALKAADVVQSRLSSFYDQAFVDPAGWRSGPSMSVWSAFAKDTGARARRDAKSLTLGPVHGLVRLNVGRTLLEVRVLLDPSLHAAAAIATVSFDATGSLRDGGVLTVHNSARFLLRPGSGGWLIVGYPRADTEVDVVPAAPTAGPSGGTASGIPVPTGSSS